MNYYLVSKKTSELLPWYDFLSSSIGAESPAPTLSTNKPFKLYPAFV
jgi:hypothetical protein